MKTKISNITLFTALSIASVFSGIILWNMQSTFTKFSRENQEGLRTFYVDQQKKLIKNEVERLVKRIHATKKAVIKAAEQDLKDQVRSAQDFIQTIYVTHKGEQYKTHIDTMISSFNWANKLGYFYILSGDGTIKHHGARPELVGKNIYSLKDKFPGLMKFLEEVKTQGSALGEYMFYKPGKGDKLYRKLGYATYTMAFDIIIGTGYYMESLDERGKQEILGIISKDRFGYQNYGYFWIFSTDYKTIFHIDSSLYEKDLKTLVDENNKLVIKEFVDVATGKGSGFCTYFWKIPGQARASEKISYLVYIPDWDWIVGSGFYFENFYDLVRTVEGISSSLLRQEIIKNCLIIICLFVFTLAVSLFIYKRIRKIEYEQKIFLNDLLQYKTVIDKSAIVSITDLDGNIVHVNDEMCEVTGFDKDELVHATYSQLSHPDNPASTYQELWTAITKGETWRGIIKNFKKDGGYFFQKSTIVPFNNKDGEVIKYISISHDVTEVFENKSQLQKYLNYDPLTELNNRNSLLMEIKNAKSADLAIIDMDGFHQINETYGMKTGDELLKLFALRLTDHIHPYRYFVYRLHSDVFAVFSSPSDKNVFIINVENALKGIVKETFIIGDKELMVSTITGYAHGSDSIMAHADAALQFAKANNISHWGYDPLKVDNSRIYEQNVRVVKMLNSAIDEDRVVPFFQPITGSGTPKFESLMRIRDKDGGIISPAQFLDISKQTRFYPTLTQIIVKKTIDTFADDDSTFSINISTEDILNSSTMTFVYDYALEKNVMSRMILEIVESESLSSYADATQRIYRFKSAGAKIAIDDFGTGYSNFDYLLKIKADYIKIDGSIIKLINKDDRAVDIVNSIVSYANKLKMKTIAEFISNRELSAKAKALGIDYQQGFFHGKPEPVPDKTIF
ncbi:cache domain-containing protein [uncultured Desulfobacter sp.]|uniref:cache domain-containing protein n=1 Tax=uncultured Desulfobacter sp. TaxID=240139 RepID=UPI002AAA6C74|nr:cache domain-containing protein [uncultured Desulfobacter sp.]